MPNISARVCTGRLGVVGGVSGCGCELFKDLTASLEKWRVALVTTDNPPPTHTHTKKGGGRKEVSLLYVPLCFRSSM